MLQSIRKNRILCVAARSIFTFFLFQYHHIITMHRQPLLYLLAAYHPSSEYEKNIRDTMTHFIHEHHNCFSRELLIGHITGSAWVVNRTLDKTLLTHHRKLDKWLQLGGHCDGDNDVLRVALREAVEESGVYDIVPFSHDIFDLDIHQIPERRTESAVELAHLHYDVRFMLVADEAAPLSITSESKDLQWVALNDVSKLTQEESMLRMVEKTRSANRHLHF